MIILCIYLENAELVLFTHFELRILCEILGTRDGEYEDCGLMPCYAKKSGRSVSLKRQYLSTRLHGVISQKTVIFVSYYIIYQRVNQNHISMADVTQLRTRAMYDFHFQRLSNSEFLKLELILNTDATAVSCNSIPAYSSFQISAIWYR